MQRALPTAPQSRSVLHSLALLADDATKCGPSSTTTLLQDHTRKALPHSTADRCSRSAQLPSSLQPKPLGRVMVAEEVAASANANGSAVRLARITCWQGSELVLTTSTLMPPKCAYAMCQ
eukprot:5040866-Prymnesium_polylepis.1